MIDLYSAATVNDKVMPPSSGNQLTCIQGPINFCQCLLGSATSLGAIMLPATNTRSRCSTELRFAPLLTLNFYGRRRN